MMTTFLFVSGLQPAPTALTIRKYLPLSSARGPTYGRKCSYFHFSVHQLHTDYIWFAFLFFVNIGCNQQFGLVEFSRLANEKVTLG